MIKHLKTLFLKNLLDLVKVIQWNVANEIHLYRISSSIASHITNPTLMSLKTGWQDNDFTSLLYSPKNLIWVDIGKLTQKHNMHLSFHSDSHVILNLPHPEVVLHVKCDLYYHKLMTDNLNLSNLIFIVHGGGIYNDKEAAMQQWVDSFCSLPRSIRKYLVLENDEFSYGILDVLEISKRIKARTEKFIPIFLDIFHHSIFSMRNSDNRKLTDILPVIIETWGDDKIIKMHLAEQKKDAVVGMHSEIVHSISKIILTFSQKYQRNLDVMIEADGGKAALLLLRK